MADVNLSTGQFTPSGRDNINEIVENKQITEGIRTACVTQSRAEFEEAGFIPANGELAYETDMGRLVMGDGANSTRLCKEIPLQNPIDISGGPEEYAKAWWDSVYNSSALSEVKFFIFDPEFFLIIKNQKPIWASFMEIPEEEIPANSFLRLATPYVNYPNANGRFPRIINDATREGGSLQEDALQEFQTRSSKYYLYGWTTIGFDTASVNAARTQQKDSVISYPETRNADNPIRLAEETRPKNIAMHAVLINKQVGGSKIQWTKPIERPKA